MDNEPKYPGIEVELLGYDGNAGYMITKVRKALRRGGVPGEEISEFSTDAVSGNYDHVLQTIMKWVEVS